MYLYVNGDRFSLSLSPPPLSLTFSIYHTWLFLLLLRPMPTPLTLSITISSMPPLFISTADDTHPSPRLIPHAPIQLQTPLNPLKLSIFVHRGLLTSILPPHPYLLLLLRRASSPSLNCCLLRWKARQGGFGISLLKVRVF